MPALEATSAPVVRPRIAFSCLKCGMKFNVAEEFAGRSTRCPACKEALRVPTMNVTRSGGLQVLTWTSAPAPRQGQVTPHEGGTGLSHRSSFLYVGHE